MVVNLCLPPFQTTVRCNKLCADGYDVSNLVSSDPSLCRRGLKLEYFMRPPVEVTLSFRWQVEVCGVDVELWPSGMDQTGAIRRLQIHSSSDANSTSDATAAATQEGFLQVGRCDIRDGVLLCFRNPRFRPRAPFTHHHPPPPKEGAVRSDLWSRGVQSLGSIAQLRLSIVFSSAGASLGFRTLAVWGVPARSCTPEALEEFQTAHQRCCPQPPLATTRAIRPPIHNPSDPPIHNVSLNPDPAAPDDKSDIPDEFLDPLTQELMVLPMVLPSGAVLDLSSLEEYQRNEARWGRSPNDPFTGVPFTADSKALPFPLLKARIDQMVLRRSWRPGVSGRGEASAAAAGTDVSPQTSRLILRQTTMSPPSSLASHHHTPSDSTTSCNQHTVHPHKSTSDSLTIHTQSKCSSSRNGVVNLHTASSLTSSEDTSHHQGQGGEVVTPAGARSQVQRRKRRLEESSVDEDTLKGLEGETSTSAGVGERSFQSCKKVGADQQTNSIVSHEERLTASLDAALSSALQGRPSYTSQKRRQECTPQTGEGQCAGCSASLTRYPTSPVAYTLPCRHLLCRPCLTRKDPQSAGVSQVTCPTCKSTAPASAVTRVHH